MADLWAEDKLTMKELAEARSKKKVSPGIRETFQLLHFVLLGCVSFGPSVVEDFEMRSWVCAGFQKGRLESVWSFCRGSRNSCPLY